jgi:hypothetical protein
MLHLLLLVPALAVPSPSPKPGKKMTISVDANNGELRLTWDSRVLSEAKLRTLAELSPDNSPDSRVMPLQIDMCPDKDPRYLPCGTRDPSAPHFVENAAVNLQLAGDMLKELKAREVVPELEPVKVWLVGLCTSWLEIEERKLAWAKSRDLEVLKEPVGGIDPKVECKDALAAVAATANKGAQWEAVKYKWHNCVNDKMQTHAGDYPKAAWKKFLSAYGIKARLVQENPD